MTGDRKIGILERILACANIYIYTSIYKRLLYLYCVSESVARDQLHLQLSLSYHSPNVLENRSQNVRGVIRVRVHWVSPSTRCHISSR